MRLVIQKHTVTTRCERCLPGVLEQHHDCFHILEEVEDGLPNATLVIRSEVENETDEIYELTPEQVALMRTEGPEAVLAEIDAWKAQQTEV